jgi:hypothetical protein
VSEEMVHQRLRRVRLERGASHKALAHQCALRVEWLQAMDEGRFSDLPSGIYGRSAVRRYAEALGLEPDEVLADCAPHLRAVEDPITALGRLRGVPASWRANHPIGRHSENGEDKATEQELTASSPELPSWRLLVAAAVDAIVVVGLLMAVVTCTVAIGIPVSGLDSTAASAFALLTFVLGGCYFVVLGGLVGETAGEHVAGVHSEVHVRRPLDLRAVRVRTLECVLRDAHFIELLGKWVGRKGKRSLVPFPFSLTGDL